MSSEFKPTDGGRTQSVSHAIRHDNGGPQDWPEGLHPVTCLNTNKPGQGGQRSIFFLDALATQLQEDLQVSSC
jgi:hypothetical protein